MSYHYHSTTTGTSSSRGYSSSGSTTTTGIAEVAGGTAKIWNYLCDTRFETFSSFCTWSVTRLSTLPSGTTGMESIPFFHQNSSQWSMVLTKQSDGLYLHFKLKKWENGNSLRVTLKADEILSSGERKEVYRSAAQSLSVGGESGQKLVRQLGTSKNEDKITIQCEISIQCIIQDNLPVPDTVEPYINVIKGMDEMFDKQVLTDFELHTRGTVLKAHRAVLSVQSPYFAALLQPHTKEAKESRVEVTDVMPEVLKQVLLYMYKGAAPALEDMAWDLLIAADKYQMPKLKSQCENHIASCLNIDNVAETAANARIFSCGVLWDRAVLYIKQNLSKVMRTPGWRDIVASHPDAVQCLSEMME